jgi:acyl-CoA synthetase (AMP-forming)/AMP-acid ligase II
VAVLSQNSGRLLTAFFGVSGYGRILVPINFRLAAEEVKYIIEHSGARVLLVDPELDEAMAAVTCEHRFVIGAESDAVLLRYDLDPTPWDADEDATATINYTSGTTARPKGVQCTHRNLWLNAATFGWQLGVSDRDVYLHTLPQFHCNGWGMVYAVTGMGGRHIVLRKVDGAEILRRIEQHGVTLLCGAPAVVAMILEAARTWEADTGRPVPGRGLVRMVVAGAPPPTSVIEKMETELGWEFVQIYGLTETSPLLTMNRARSEYDDLSPTERAQKLGRAGAPAIGVDIRISPQGEILARSNVIMAGYWNQPDATADAIHAASDDTDGAEWFHTGDGGFVDDENHVTISDRKKDVIVSGGENVSSIEVEDALFSHPEVAEVAVIGVPDEKWGELVLALVVRTEGSDVSDDALIAHVRTKLAGYKCPKRIEFRDALARTATGKLQKFKLREPYWEGHDRLVN